MKHISKLILLWALMIAATASAEAPYDGIYYPAGAQDWSCNIAELGGDIGALGVVDSVLYGLENTCDLDNPTQIRDMEATLYDAHCSGEGFTDTHRLMLMTSDNGIYVIQNGYVVEWELCR
ncbi:hypothetical protein [Aliiroseovarius sp. PrR006]|uniref:hypothetical protein n=1 Tax=Aliiroseovarius sp. PrR006 TaxID=2706883 RepID=UPI0013D2099A|nr:hypothetical protein [Aliiroseovarius sp. PrR006]NDW53896.1 hypothetical protein [Aliiroseovarius sp. PrR006]